MVNALRFQEGGQARGRINERYEGARVSRDTHQGLAFDLWSDRPSGKSLRMAMGLESYKLDDKRAIANRGDGCGAPRCITHGAVAGSSQPGSSHAGLGTA